MVLNVNGEQVRFFHSIKKVRSLALAGAHRRSSCSHAHALQLSPKA